MRTIQGYADGVDTDDRMEREALLTELLAMQGHLEASLTPEIIESVLTLRLTMQQLKVLTLLVTEPEGSTIQVLARTAGVSLATMSGIVDRLESQDVAQRTADPRDQRVRRVTATASGRETVRQLLVVRPQFSRSPLDRLDLDDLRALAQGVRALLKSIKGTSPEK